MAEIVVVDAVPVIEPLRLVPHHHQGRAQVGLADQVIVVEPVVVAVQRHPVIGRAAIRFVEAVDHHGRHPALDGAAVAGSAEGHHLARRRPAVSEHQIRDHQLAPRHPQVRLPRQDHAAGRLRRQGDRLALQALGVEYDLEIAPDPVGQDDGVPRTGGARGALIFILGPDQGRGSGKGRSGPQQNDRRGGRQSCQHSRLPVGPTWRGRVFGLHR